LQTRNFTRLPATGVICPKKKLQTAVPSPNAATRATTLEEKRHAIARVELIATNPPIDPHSGRSAATQCKGSSNAIASKLWSAAACTLNSRPDIFRAAWEIAPLGSGDVGISSSTCVFGEINFRVAINAPPADRFTAVPNSRKFRPSWTPPMNMGMAIDTRLHLRRSTSWFFGKLAPPSRFIGTPRTISPPAETWLPERCREVFHC
jgi:hypothetical protein